MCNRASARRGPLLAFGLLIAVLGTVELARAHPAPWTLQTSRAEGLSRTLAALNSGGPILTERIGAGPTLYDVGGSDDQGLYLLVPLLSRVIGSSDPVDVLRWLCLVAFAIPLVFYPLLIRELSGSPLAAMAAPIALLAGLVFMPLGDLYWVTAWAIVTLLPLLLWLDRHWPRHGSLLLLGALVAASLTSTIRSQAGLPVILCALLVVIARPWIWWRRLGLIVLCVLASLSVSTFGMAGARAYRNYELHGKSFVSQSGTGHPFWHNVYIGLGYLPNRWDIRYYDGVAYRDVLRQDPKARFLGPAYSRILRDRYIKLIGNDPGFAAKTYGEKLIVAIKPAWPALMLVAIAGPWLLLTGARRRHWRREALFLSVGAVSSLAAPLLATPYSGYLLGWLAAALVGAILTGAAMLGAFRSADGISRAVGRWIALTRSRSGRLAAAFSSAGLAVIVVCIVTAPGIQRTADGWQRSAPQPHISQPSDATD